MKQISSLMAIARRPAAVLAVSALIFGLATALTSSPISAEGDLQIRSAHVTVEPEYDEPRVLVIEQGTFAGDSFPAQVSFYLPAGAEPTEVCGLKQPGDEHLCQLYETRVEGGAVVLTYMLPVPDYYFEYYYNPIQGAGARQLSFAFQPNYAIETLQVAVQQPLRSTGFTLDPSTSQTSSDGQGFKYYLYNFSDLKPQKAVDLKIGYQKADDRPSVAKRTGGGVSTGGAEDKTGLVALAIGVAGALGFVGYLAVRRRPEEVQVTGRRAAVQAAEVTARQSAPARSRGQGKAPAFCSMCGTALQGDENFCSSCGQRVRKISD